jgi:hypothetical protein
MALAILLWYAHPYMVNMQINHRPIGFQQKGVPIKLRLRLNAGSCRAEGNREEDNQRRSSGHKLWTLAAA